MLVLGGTGFVGQPLVRALAQLDDDVIAASRAGNGPKGVPLDRRDVDSVRALVRERRIETVVDLLAYTEADTLPLLAALDGQIGRWVMASSCDVYRNYEGLHRKAQPESILEPLAEDSPLRELRHPYRAAPRRDPMAPDAWMDDYDKIPIETSVQGMACEWTILRLPMVYGPGDRQRRFRWAIAPMLSKAPSLEAPSAWLDWTTTYGFIDNVAAAVALAAAHERAANAVFNVADEPVMAHGGWIDRFRSATGWTGAPEPTEAETPFARAISALDLSVPLDVSSQRLFADLGFNPPVAADAAAQLTVADEAARQEAAARGHAT